MSRYLVTIQDLHPKANLKRYQHRVEAASKREAFSVAAEQLAQRRNLFEGCDYHFVTATEIAPNFIG